MPKIKSIISIEIIMSFSWEKHMDMICGNNTKLGPIHCCININVISAKMDEPGCTNNSCMYGGGQGAVDYDHIYDCKQCTGPASSSICARCLLNGGTCEPGHDQWEPVTWTLYIWIFVILSPLCRPTFHSRIPEWRTVFIFYFILFYMGSYVCYMYHGSLQ